MRGSILKVLPPAASQESTMIVALLSFRNVSHSDGHLHRTSPLLLKGTFQETATANSLRPWVDHSHRVFTQPDDNNDLERP